MERDGRESNAGNDMREVWKRNIDRAHYEDSAERLKLEIEQAAAAKEMQERRDALSELDTYQRNQLKTEERAQQARITELAAQLEERSQLGILWEKLRGRIAWNTESELETARISLEEAEERSRAFEVVNHRQEQQQSDVEASQDKTEPEKAPSDYTPQWNEYAIPPPEQTRDIHTMATVTAAIPDTPEKQQQEPRINDYMAELEAQQRDSEQIERTANAFAQARQEGQEMGGIKERDNEMG
jgi:hypothetical protein